MRDVSATFWMKLHCVSWRWLQTYTLSRRATCIILSQFLSQLSSTLNFLQECICSHMPFSLAHRTSHALKCTQGRPKYVRRQTLHTYCPAFKFTHTHTHAERATNRILPKASGKYRKNRRQKLHTQCTGSWSSA